MDPWIGISLLCQGRTSPWEVCPSAPQGVPQLISAINACLRNKVVAVWARRADQQHLSDLTTGGLRTTATKRQMWQAPSETQAVNHTASTLSQISQIGKFKIPPPHHSLYSARERLNHLTRDMICC